MALMSYYDPVEDKIHNCEPGSYAYAHEERHREQYRSGIATRLDKMSVWCYYCAIFAGFFGLVATGITGMIFGIGLCMFPMIVGNFGLEVDAYIVGFINYKMR